MNANSGTATTSVSNATSQAFTVPRQDLDDLVRDPPIDHDQLLQLCMGDSDFLVLMLNEFDRTCGNRIEKFRTALQSHDHATISAQAHGLNGVAGFLAARRLQGICCDLESSADDVDWEQIHDQIDRLEFELERTINYIPILREMR